MKYRTLFFWKKVTFYVSNLFFWEKKNCFKIPSADFLSSMLKVKARMCRLSGSLLLRYAHRALLCDSAEFITDME